MKRMTIALLATVASAGLMSSAYAADLIIEEPMAEVGIVDVGGDWDGAYIGVFAGGGWAFADHTSLVPGNDLDLAGWKIGVTAGANFTVSEAIILGIAADIAWADITGADDTLFGDPTHTINWDGSIRGRLGFDGGAFMPYVTAGFAFANATRTTESGGGDEVSNTHIGWTAGVGVEFAATEDMSIDLQYRYTDLGEEQYVWPNIIASDPVIDINSHALTVGLNWHF
jgi:outer membrane immunogenic protein